MKSLAYLIRTSTSRSLLRIAPSKMSKLTRIKACADAIVNDIIRTDEENPHGPDRRVLRKIYDRSQAVHDNVILDCVELSERCNTIELRLSVRPGAHVDTRPETLIEIEKIERACGRIVRDCLLFHASVEELSQRSVMYARKAKSNFEARSQISKVQRCKEMRRLANELARSMREMLRLQKLMDAEGVEESAVSSSADGLYA